MKLFQLVATIGISIVLIGCGEETGHQASQSDTPSADLRTSGESGGAKASGGSAVKDVSVMISEAADDAVAVNTACPITGEVVNEDGGRLTYAGKVVGFCCRDCIPAFKADPAKYAATIK